MWQTALIGVMVWGITGNYVYGAIAMIQGFITVVFCGFITTVIK